MDEEIRLECLRLVVDQLPNNDMALQISIARQYYDFVIGAAKIELVNPDDIIDQPKTMTYG